MTNLHPRRHTLLVYLGWTALASVCLTISCGAGGLIGVIIGESQGYHRRFLEERDLCAPIIAADQAFTNVKINRRSNGGIYLSGEVSSEEERQRLASSIFRTLGESRGRQVMLAVSVKTQSKSAP